MRGFFVAGCCVLSGNGQTAELQSIVMNLRRRMGSNPDAMWGPSSEWKYYQTFPRHANHLDLRTGPIIVARDSNRMYILFSSI
jgi:hypothetical protein